MLIYCCWKAISPYLACLVVILHANIGTRISNLLLLVLADWTKYGRFVMQSCDDGAVIFALLSVFSVILQLLKHSQLILKQYTNIHQRYSITVSVITLMV